MQLKKIGVILLKSAILLVPIQLFFVFLILEIASNFFYEINYEFIYIISLLVAIGSILILNILAGFFLDIVYEKLNEFVSLVAAFFVFLIIGAYFILFKIFSWPVDSLRGIFGSFLSFPFIGFLLGYLFLLIISSIGIFTGIGLRKYMDRAK